MSRLHRAWTYVASAVAMVGIALAWFGSPLKAVILAIGASIVTWAVMSLRPVVPPPGRIATVTAVAAVSVVAVTGLVGTAGALGLTIVCLVGMTAPPTVAAVRPLQDRYFPRSSRAPVRPVTEPSREQTATHGHADAGRSFTGTHQHRTASWDPAAPSAMPDLELCRAWRASYTALQQLPFRDHAPIVAFRAAILDELHARHPQGFIRWINDGARAASNPARYLASEHEQADGSRPETGQAES